MASHLRAALRRHDVHEEPSRRCTDHHTMVRQRVKRRLRHRGRQRCSLTVCPFRPRAVLHRNAGGLTFLGSTPPAVSRAVSACSARGSRTRPRRRRTGASQQPLSRHSDNVLPWTRCRGPARHAPRIPPTRACHTSCTALFYTYPLGYMTSRLRGSDFLTCTAIEPFHDGRVNIPTEVFLGYPPSYTERSTAWTSKARRLPMRSVG